MPHTKCQCPKNTTPITLCRDQTTGQVSPPNIVIENCCEPPTPQVLQSKGEYRQTLRGTSTNPNPNANTFIIPAGVLRYSITKVKGAAQYVPPANAANQYTDIFTIVEWQDTRTTHAHQYVTPKAIPIAYSPDAIIQVAWTMP